MIWFVTRAHHEEVVATYRANAERLLALIATNDAALREERERYTQLVKETMHAPHLQHPEPPKSPLSALGPKTHAALVSEGRGQSPEIRRGMQAKALALHAQGLKDEAVADAVYRGEPVGI